MVTMERDPQHTADTLRSLRKQYQLTQENLAGLANLSTRTIEKAESGRHCLNLQTLRSIARAFDLNVRVFDKPTPEEEQQRKKLERALRKTVLVETQPIRSASDFLGAFAQRHAFRIDTTAVDAPEALDLTASMTDWITDLNDIWDECSASHRLECANSFVELCRKLETHGLVCYMGHHRQRRRERGRPDLVFDVGLMSIQAKEGVDGTRYALVQLEGDWETLDEDRIECPGKEKQDD